MSFLLSKIGYKMLLQMIITLEDIVFLRMTHTKLALVALDL